MKITSTQTTTTLDGTPEELARFYAASGTAPGMPIAADKPAEASTEEAEAAPTAPAAVGPGKPQQFVDEKLARRFLTRRPLSVEQKAVLRAIYEAHPARVPATVLQKKTGYSPRQLAGLMGAFGRRLANTPGYQKGDNVFDWRWNDDGWHYGLPDSMRAALAAEGLV